MVLHHILDFLVDYFTNLNARKILGGILVLAGLASISRIGSSENPDSAILYAIGGILVGGIGAVVIYYDMAKNKLDYGYEETRTLTKAYEQKRREESKATTWHMNHEPGKKDTSD